MLIELIKRVPGARYRAIVEVISNEISSGRLAVGERLPTHRELARQLDLDVGTASRAYTELRRMGLISGEIGRGTFVSEIVRDAPASISGDPSAGSFIDLSHNFPVGAPCDPRVAAIVDSMLAESKSHDLLNYQIAMGLPRHREAGRAWLSFMGLTDDEGEIAVTAGAQHGLFLAIAALTRPGDRIMTEAVTYFGLKSIATILGLEIVPVAIDAEGLVPESFAAACRESGAKVLCCSPTLHNPTTAVMPLARRREIAAIAREHGVNLIEDDVYSFLLDEPLAPICDLAPERTIFISSLSKCIGPGLRIGFIRFPGHNADRISLAMRATTLMAPPLAAEIVLRMVEQNADREIAVEQRKEIARRQLIARDILGGFELQAHPQAFHVWLKMANGWSPRDFADEAKRHGVGIAPGEIFSVSPVDRPGAVRICVSAAKNINQLKRALSVLRDILADAPRTTFPVK